MTRHLGAHRNQLVAPPWLPGYLLRPDDRPVRRPTVILNNGEDAQNITLYALGAADALVRGYNAARAGQVFSDMYDFGTIVMKFTVADVVGQVTAPTLVTVYDQDTLVIPVAQQGTQVYNLLRSDKQIHQFTEAEGAQEHCAPMAPQTRNQAVYDWLDGIF
jgi:hypothetical protein